jgi:hypothetical protein
LKAKATSDLLDRFNQREQSIDPDYDDHKRTDGQCEDVYAEHPETHALIHLQLGIAENCL